MKLTHEILKQSDKVTEVGDIYVIRICDYSIIIIEDDLSFGIFDDIYTSDESVCFKDDKLETVERLETIVSCLSNKTFKL